MRPPEHELDQAVRRIVDRVHPRRVVLFGSRARGDAKPWSDFDLMIELDTAPSWDEKIAIRAEALRGCPTSFDLHFFTPADIAEQRDDGGRVIYDVVREGKVLFVHPTLAGEPAFPSSVREADSQWGSAGDAVRNAERDMIALRSISSGREIPWEIVAFHAQQAAEKYLKSLLLSQRLRPERTHDLNTLLAACRDAGNALPDLDEACELLTPYAITGRYGPPLDDEAAGQVAVAAANAIAAAVRSVLPPSIR